MKPEDIKFADQNAVRDPGLALYIDRVLEAVGHPDALVTDESKIWDFLEFGSEPHRFRRARGPWGEWLPGDPEVKARNDALLASMAQQLGVRVDRVTSSWPSPTASGRASWREGRRGRT